ncbi:MAG: hypothetical protein WCF84_14325 [Anaerolineae bacterium]
MAPFSGRIDQVLWVPWQRWDTIWYTKIAEQGYSASDQTTAFFPLYPLLIKLVAPLFAGNTVAAGVIVASLAALAGLMLFYRWTADAFGRAAAERGLVYLALFPSALFLFAAYTESLFLALVLASFILARRGSWGWVGIVGGLAALTRVQGLLLMLPLVVEFWLQYRHGRVRLVKLLCLVPVVATGALFFLYLLRLTGSASAWFAIEGAWRTWDLPWAGALNSLYNILYSGEPAAILLNLLDLGTLLLFLVLLAWSMRKQRWPEAALMAMVILPPLFTIARFSPLLPLASISRFVLVAFPGFALLGTRRLRAPWNQLLVAFALLFQVFMLILFTQWVLIG